MNERLSAMRCLVCNAEMILMEAVQADPTTLPGFEQKWGRLTDDDLDVIKGRQDQLEGKIQERYGLAKDQAKKDVEAWFKSLP